MKRTLLNDWKLYYGGECLSAQVPGDILLDLYRDGKMEDPYYADNAIRACAYLEKEAEYVSVFTLKNLTQKAVLIFEGVDTYADIYVNGKLIGHTENMFLKYAFDVSQALVVGENTVRVRMLPVSRFVDDEYHGRGCFSTKRLQLRKTQCHFGWDWAPNLHGYGIWLPVTLECSDGNSIEYDYIQPCNDGKIKIVTEICGNGDLEIEIGGKDYGKYPVFNGENVIEVHVEAPELWWPNGYGTQRLYRYILRLTADGAVKDERAGRFAFREVKIEENNIGGNKREFAFTVNGKRIFARGSNWVPCSNQTGAIPDEEYQTLLKYAKDAGYTMLRNWGGGNYEKELFYDLCDEYGILVWQDLMFACEDAPEGVNIVERIKPELTYQLKRLRRHPCIGIICGGNEWATDNPYNNEPVLSVLKEYSERFIPELRFIPSSPFGDSGFKLDDSQSGDSHVSSFFAGFDANDFQNFRRYIDNNRAQFYSECAVLGSCRIRSLKKFIPKTALWPINDIWDFHFVKHPFDPVSGRTYARLEYQQAEIMFGEITSLEDFVKKSMITHGETLGAEIDYARMYKHCRGFMNWMYNDNWGCGTWSVVDKYMELKPAYYYQKRSYKPMLVRYVLRDGKWGLYVANDAMQPYKGKVTYGVKKLDGTVLEEQSVCVEIEPSEVVCVTELCETQQGDYRFASFDDGTDTTVLFLKEQIQYSWSTDLDVRFVRETEEGIEILLKANAYARCVFVDYPTRIVCSDNYFDMEKGEEKIVRVEGITKENFSQVSVKTFADVWEE